LLYVEIFPFVHPPIRIVFEIFICCAPFGNLYFLSFQLLNKPELGAGIDPGMAMTPFQSSIGHNTNPQPCNRKSSTLTTRPEITYKIFIIAPITARTNIV
jgi:hypothetical protein